MGGEGMGYISRHGDRSLRHARHARRVRVSVRLTHVGVGGHVFCLSATNDRATKGGHAGGEIAR